MMYASLPPPSRPATVGAMGVSIQESLIVDMLKNRSTAGSYSTLGGNWL